MIPQIRAHLVTDFERRLFEAALKNLSDVGNPLRFNNFAYSLRELTRHVLRRLAPDNNVRNCPWYRPETQIPNGVSRRQRIVFAVQGGLNDKYVGHTLGIDVAALHKKLLYVVDNLSKYTHIEEYTFNVAQTEIDRLSSEALAAVNELFDVIERCKTEVTSALEVQVNKEVVNQAISETILEIDELATHHTIDAVYTDRVEVTSIDDVFINIAAQ